jgi:hypothetical protein
MYTSVFDIQKLKRSWKDDTPKSKLMKSFKNLISKCCNLATMVDSWGRSSLLNYRQSADRPSRSRY